jgi:hypothetical protein
MPMNQQVKIIAVVDQIQLAEQRHYVALQQYARAIRSVTSPELLERLKADLSDSFAELKAAHDRLSLHGE